MKRVIGFWLSQKKSRKMNFADFGTMCGNVGMDLVQIDLNHSIAKQGPFDVIIHKLTDVIALAENGDNSSINMCRNLEEYVAMYPNVVMIDPLVNVRLLMDRYKQYTILADCLSCTSPDITAINAFVPAFVDLRQTDVEKNARRLCDYGVEFPLVCKPIMAHGSSDTHKMAIIFNEAGLADVQPPCVAQTFINHNAVLFKLFVIGDIYEVVERPSIKNLYAGDHKTIFFDSHDVSRANASSFLNELDERDQGQGGNHPMQPLERVLSKLVSHVRHVLGLTLLGIDVIVDRVAGRCAIVDVNAFPGYDGVPNFFSRLLECIEKKIETKENNSVTRNNCQFAVMDTRNGELENGDKESSLISSPPDDDMTSLIQHSKDAHKPASVTLPFVC